MREEGTSVEKPPPRDLAERHVSVSEREGSAIVSGAISGLVILGSVRQAEEAMSSTPSWPLYQRTS